MDHVVFFKYFIKKVKNLLRENVWLGKEDRL